MLNSETKIRKAYDLRNETWMAHKISSYQIDKEHTMTLTIEENFEKAEAYLNDIKITKEFAYSFLKETGCHKSSQIQLRVKEGKEYNFYLENDSICKITSLKNKEEEILIS